MIRKLIPLVPLILSGSSIAQVNNGIKDVAKSAQVDVVNKGILIPKIDTWISLLSVETFMDLKNSSYTSMVNPISNKESLAVTDT